MEKQLVVQSKLNHNISFYEQAISILTSQGKYYINLGLERVQNILYLLDNPQNTLKYVHVAGTNGKGSVCAMLSSILCEAGLKVGLFTSPHVFEYTERIKINDSEIEKDIFAKNIINIVDLAEKNKIHLTEFEILTVVAFQYFAENNVDIVILETGLGGRLDATNVIDNNICSIITHIDLDHTERLGNTIEKIAIEKAGIIKKSCPVIINETNSGVTVVKEVTGQNASEVFVVDEVANFPMENLPLHATYQKENLALVLKTIEILGNNGFDVSENDINVGLNKVIHPCRFEYLKEKNILIDGAHNPNGTKALRKSLDYYFPNEKFKFIFGCLNNKEYAVMMDNLFTPKDDIYFYQFDNPNSCQYELLSSNCKFLSKPFSEYRQEDNILTVICGSFYMIKELLNKMVIK